jgi:hypothetical protein
MTIFTFIVQSRDFDGNLPKCYVCNKAKTEIEKNKTNLAIVSTVVPCTHPYV